MSISVNEIRKDFPLLENQKVIYLDTAATSPEADLCPGSRAGIL